MTRRVLLLGLSILSVALLRAQDRPPFQTDFPAEELVQRRARVIDAVGAEGIAIVQGAPGVDGFKVFRQTNEFYYLTGLETPHAYLLLDGRTRKTTLFLTPRNEALERSGGAMWAAEDAMEVMRLTGVDAVAPVDLLSRQTFNAMLRPPRPTLHVPFSPAEGEAQSRDEILGHQAGVAADPWDGRPSREAHFMRLLADRYPALECPIKGGFCALRVPRRPTRRPADLAADVAELLHQRQRPPASGGQVTMLDLAHRRTRRSTSAATAARVAELSMPRDRFPSEGLRLIMESNSSRSSPPASG